MSEAYKKKKDSLKLRDDKPLFTVAMAAAFFDLSSQSLRQKEQYLFDSFGEPIVISRTPGGDRRYSLNDILKIAHALRRMNKMTDRQLRLIILRVDSFKEPIKKTTLKYRKGTIKGVRVDPT